jgi:hypothetical protein
VPRADAVPVAQVDVVTVHYTLQENVVGAPATFGAAADHTKYYRALLFKDPKSSCTKSCCKTQGSFATKKFTQSGEETLVDNETNLTGIKLKNARLEAQQKAQKAKFLPLAELTDDTDLNYEMVTGDDESQVIHFESQTVAQQMLDRLDFRFFAGFTQDQLDELVSTGQVHPKTMLDRDDHGNFKIHSVNYMHVHDRASRYYQWFSCLASAGKVVHLLEQSTKKEEDFTCAKEKFESVPFISSDGRHTNVANIAQCRRLSLTVQWWEIRRYRCRVDASGTYVSSQRDDRGWKAEDIVPKN